MSIQRAVKVEAGHRCAIPTCRATSALELAHIEPWSKVKEHTFDNLILLCAVCHTRFDRDEIDRLAMLQYKANLSVLSNRYGEFERRVLEMFTVAKEPPTEALVLTLPWGRDLDLWYLLRDGLMRKLSEQEASQHIGGTVAIFGQPTQEAYRLTALGVAFVRALRDAQPVD